MSRIPLGSFAHAPSYRASFRSGPATIVGCANSCCDARQNPTIPISDKYFFVVRRPISRSQAMADNQSNRSSRLLIRFFEYLPTAPASLSPSCTRDISSGCTSTGCRVSHRPTEMYSGRTVIHVKAVCKAKKRQTPDSYDRSKRYPACRGYMTVISPCDWVLTRSR
jgi:hypothetical protein